MPYGVLQQRWPLMPAGIPVGDDLSLPLREALSRHAGVPMAYQPVVEEGSYDDFKACVFRVCSVRVCEVALEDMAEECREKGGVMRAQQRRWNYSQDRHCVTSVEVNMEVKRGSVLSHELDDFLSYLARKYGFLFNKVCVNYQRERAEMIGYERGYYHEGSIAVEMELVWPYWT